MRVYYNEIDGFAAGWLRNLMDHDLIPRGDVDEKDIRKLGSSTIAGQWTCHFFAGIGGWAHALELAGWPADLVVWTGSCPCQPFSSAGKRKGEADDRHLWPAWRELISAGRPPIIFGEQVASEDGRRWLAGVQADVEEMGYAFGAADLCAAGIEAPHIRQRLFWVADYGSNGRDKSPKMARARTGESIAGDGREDSGMANAEDSDGGSKQQQESPGCGWPGSAGGGGLGKSDSAGSQQGREAAAAARYGHTADTTSGLDDAMCPRHGGPEDEICTGRDAFGRSGGVGDSDSGELEGRSGQPARKEQPTAAGAGLWADRRWIPCTDGKSRCTQHGALPLAYGLPRSLGTSSPREDRLRLDAAKAFYKGSLKGYGNAIVPALAAEFIKAYLEAREES